MAIECLTNVYARICSSTFTNSCSGDVVNVYKVITPSPDTYTSCINLIAQPTDFSSQIFNITAAEGAQLSAAIVAVWAIAFAVRQGIKASNVDER